ncbi:4-hydroxybutyrate coenzyme A transferase-like [Saccostrea echinata]|uniref:4-hydroxybutyrate coenzyme A transferase-like n=1 Tax=Saccostrea echinata TaxID=191078 RepID=UPI002A81672A|nr:4-hydroxybutyrate coenzyme A transferase-like [Saccostrea echinata]
MNILQKIPRLFIKASKHHACVSRSFYLYSPEPLHPILDKVPKWTTAEEAVEVIESGHRIYIQGGASSPLSLVDAMCAHGEKAKLKDVEVIEAPIQARAPYTDPKYEGIFRPNSFFISASLRNAVAEGRADTIPIFLSEIPLLFRRRLLSLDVALISLSPPDKHGFCSLGPGIDCTRAAVQNAQFIIGLVNKQMPRTFGDGLVHSSHIDILVEADEPLTEIAPTTLSPEILEVARLIADNLVEDGATIQTGIGNLPAAVLHKLQNHKDLGIHSEMFSDSVVDLVECGAITNAKKAIQTGKIVSSFAIGSKRLYDFMDDNSFVAMCDCSFTNNQSVICQNPRVTAINTCLEIDITGQVCSDSLGTYMYSGFGGQIDFIRGAAVSLDGEGKPIIACTSTVHRKNSGNKGVEESRIVTNLKPGAGVVTTRAHVHYIVTEYGIAYLFGKNLRQRAYELIKVAHPNHRETLEKAAYERLKCMPSP